MDITCLLKQDAYERTQKDASILKSLEKHLILWETRQDTPWPRDLDYAVYVITHGGRGKRLYRKYLQSDHWKRTRERKLKSIHFHCERCGDFRRKFQIHHKHYRTLGRESDDDLIALCGACHKKEHRK